MNATTEGGSDDERPGKKSEAATATANDKRATTGRARQRAGIKTDADKCAHGGAERGEARRAERG